MIPISRRATQVRAFVDIVDVIKADLPKLSEFWFLKYELQRKGGFRGLSKILSERLKTITKPRLGFVLQEKADELGHGEDKKCFFFDDGKGLLCLWNQNLPKSYFWFIRYVLRLGDIATFSDLEELLIYQEERYMR